MSKWWTHVVQRFRALPSLFRENMNRPPSFPLGRWNNMHDDKSVYLKIDYANLDSGVAPTLRPKQKKI